MPTPRTNTNSASPFKDSSQSPDSKETDNLNTDIERASVTTADSSSLRIAEGIDFEAETTRGDESANSESGQFSSADHEDNSECKSPIFRIKQLTPITTDPVSSGHTPEAERNGNENKENEVKGRAARNLSNSVCFLKGFARNHAKMSRTKREAGTGAPEDFENPDRLRNETGQSTSKGLTGSGGNSSRKWIDGFANRDSRLSSKSKDKNSPRRKLTWNAEPIVVEEEERLPESNAIAHSPSKYSTVPSRERHGRLRRIHIQTEEILSRTKIWQLESSKHKPQLASRGIRRSSVKRRQSYVSRGSREKLPALPEFTPHSISREKLKTLSSHAECKRSSVSLDEQESSVAPEYKLHSLQRDALETSPATTSSRDLCEKNFAAPEYTPCIASREISGKTFSTSGCPQFIGSPERKEKLQNSAKRVSRIVSQGKRGKPSAYPRSIPGSVSRGRGGRQTTSSKCTPIKASLGRRGKTTASSKCTSGSVWRRRRGKTTASSKCTSGSVSSRRRGKTTASSKGTSGSVSRRRRGSPPASSKCTPISESQGRRGRSPTSSKCTSASVSKGRRGSPPAFTICPSDSSTCETFLMPLTPEHTADDDRSPEKKAKLTKMTAGDLTSSRNGVLIEVVGETCTRQTPSREIETKDARNTKHIFQILEEAEVGAKEAGKYCKELALTKREPMRELPIICSISISKLRQEAEIEQYSDKTEPLKKPIVYEESGDESRENSSEINGDEPLQNSSKIKGDQSLENSSETIRDEPRENSSETRGNEPIVNSSESSGDESMRKSSESSGDESMRKSSESSGEESMRKSSESSEDESKHSSETSED